MKNTKNPKEQRWKNNEKTTQNTDKKETLLNHILY